VKLRGSQCNETLLVRAAVRPGKKLGLQSAAKNLQWRRFAASRHTTAPSSHTFLHPVTRKLLLIIFFASAKVNIANRKMRRWLSIGRSDRQQAVWACYKLNRQKWLLRTPHSARHARAQRQPAAWQSGLRKSRLNCRVLIAVIHRVSC